MNLSYRQANLKLISFPREDCAAQRLLCQLATCKMILRGGEQIIEAVEARICPLPRNEKMLSVDCLVEIDDLIV